jgi:hypothetical protein
MMPASRFPDWTSRVKGSAFQNPILEDFKLKHRELDVYMADEDVRRKGLENIRLAARLLNAEREDPEIDKKILVNGSGLSPSINVDNP